jgi:hypothetical protein
VTAIGIRAQPDSKSPDGVMRKREILDARKAYGLPVVLANSEQNCQAICEKQPPPDPSKPSRCRRSLRIENLVMINC